MLVRFYVILSTFLKNFTIKKKKTLEGVVYPEQKTAAVNWFACSRKRKMDGKVTSLRDLSEQVGRPVSADAHVRRWPGRVTVVTVGPPPTLDFIYAWDLFFIIFFSPAERKWLFHMCLMNEHSKRC